MNQEHKLSRSFTFWLTVPKKKEDLCKNWEDTMLNICTFCTIEVPFSESIPISGVLEILPAHGETVFIAERLGVPFVPGWRETDVGGRIEQKWRKIHP